MELDSSTGRAYRLTGEVSHPGVTGNNGAMSGRILLRVASVLAAMAVLASGCTEPASPGDLEAATSRTVDVTETVPHDQSSFTQGLVLAPDGRMYESSGRYGVSALAQVDPASGEVLREVAVDERYFAEGLALVDDRLIQLTWKEGTALVYDAATLEVVDTFSYDGEGWGLCWDGARLVMSDGSASLTFRDPETFEATGQVEVNLDGAPVEELNELECVDDRVYANVWKTTDIVEIDPADGTVTAVVDAAPLSDLQQNPNADVLNGIAHDPETDTFWLTGKLWSERFRVELVPVEGT